MKVLILAAGNVLNKLSYIKPNSNAPALIPINSKSVIKIITDFYSRSLPQCTIYIACNQEFLSPIYDEISVPNCILVEIPKTRGVNETLVNALKVFEDDADIIVNVVTTIPTKVLNLNEVQLSSEIERSNYYSSIKTDGEDIIYNSKNSIHKEYGHPFTGVFRLKKTDIIRALDLLQEPSDLLGVIIKANTDKRLKFIFTDWIDVGHEINYFKSRKKLLISRAFNSFEILENENVIIKKSKHIEKFKNEVNYVNMLPGDIRKYYPKVIDHISFFEDYASISMEYYSYPNISEYQLYWDIDSIYWKRIFRSIDNVFTKFRKNKFSIGKKAYEDFFITKTFNRYNDFKITLAGNDQGGLLNDSIVINGKTIASFELVMNQVEIKVQSLYNEDEFGIMHGDLCFNNMLYDYVSDSLKLIDPRGSFGDNCIGVYGDLKYDVAKLVHSSVFNYDYIVNDLFNFANDKKGVFEYNFKLRNNQSLLDELSIEFIEKNGFKKEDIFFIVGLLFISMCALHNDNFKRQQIMYLHGLTIINNYI